MRYKRAPCNAAIGRGPPLLQRFPMSNPSSLPEQRRRGRQIVSHAWQRSAARCVAPVDSNRLSGRLLAKRGQMGGEFSFRATR